MTGRAWRDMRGGCSGGRYEGKDVGGFRNEFDFLPHGLLGKKGRSYLVL
jgi:hypothetical protein